MNTKATTDAVLLSTKGKAYFLKGDAYLRYTLHKSVDFGYPKKIKGNWPGFPTSFTNGIDAAVLFPNKKAYFFKGDAYLRYTPGKSVDPDYPKKIKDNWPGFPTSFTNGIDAVLLSTKGRAYFFKGPEYLRYTPGKSVDSGYPKKIKGNWPGFPTSFINGIDAAVLFPNKKAYFFKGDAYLCYTPGKSVDSGYPKKIKGNWKSLVTYTVVDKNALTRSGPPGFKPDGGKIPLYTHLIVKAIQGKYARVAGLNGRDYGWTALSNLVQGSQKAKPSSFDPNGANIAILGDSNTYVFGRALKEWYVANKMISISEKQIVVKYRSGSSPRHWLPSNHPKHDRSFGHLWAKAKRFSGPAIRDTLSGNTRLVVIGLGGNMGTGNRDRDSISQLINEIKPLAPQAKIIWRGPPPATATSKGAVASKSKKLGRYQKNKLLKEELRKLGFKVFGASDTVLGKKWSKNDRLIYLDLISLHASGPSPMSKTTVGTQKDLDFEKSVLESARDKASVFGEEATIGRWASFKKG